MTSFSFIFIQEIKNAIDTLLLILGILTSFLIVSSLIIQTLHLSAYLEMILEGILEMTMRIKELSLFPIYHSFGIELFMLYYQE